jgi:DNA polymerase-3 subunit alpha
VAKSDIEIRNELLSFVKIKDSNELKKIEQELDILSITEGLDEKSNLESFYNIWDKRKGQIGNENKINSWLAYHLGLTLAKPNGEFLPLRRAFARAGFPDIDSDFDYFHRQEIYDFIIEKFGREYVGNIGTYNGLKLKATIRRLGKALDVAGSFFKGSKANKTDNEEKVTEIVKSLPPQRGAVLKVKDEDGNDRAIKTVEDAYKYCGDFRNYIDKYPGIREHAKKIEGLTSNVGCHASGILISNVPLKQIAPLKNIKKGLVTQFPYEDLESIGLIKFDILALSSLTVIQKTIEMVKQNYGITIDIANLPLDDEKTFELYRSGNLVGVFQCENGGMQNTIQEIEASCFDDIMAAIALYRPGPMISIPEYCARKKGINEVNYFHPSIEKYVKPYLEKTYGLIVYQEQVMQICNSLADFSITEGYVMIKGVGKKKDYLIQKFKKRFLEGTAKKGVLNSVSEEYWDKYITPFSSYGFNKSHSCSYGLLSYYSAFLKANYTEEFMVSFLNVENYRKKHDKIAVLEKDLKRFDIYLHPRNINTCGVDYKIIKKKDTLSGVVRSEIMPSVMCKGMGLDAAQELEKNAPYEGLRDIAFKTNSKLFDNRAMTCLIEAGFFDNEFKEYKKANKGVKKEEFQEIILKKFTSLREDSKASKKLGLGTESLFD